MDAVDFAIYRHLSRDGLSRFWASRRVVDPRVSVREIAEAVGRSEAGVRGRMRALRDSGLLGATEVTLNPSLFGASTLVAEIPVESPLESEEVFRDLAVADGVVFARDVLDEQDRKVQVYVASEGSAAATRRAALLRRLNPGRAVRGPSPYWIPGCAREPTELDWRLLAACRRLPDATVARLASECRVSVKTAARRFDLLVDARACWWSAAPEVTEWPFALLRLTLEANADAVGIASQAAARCDSWLPIAADGLGNDPRSAPSSVAGLVPASAPAALEHTVRKVLEIDGVADVRRTFGLRSASFPGWSDALLARRLPARSR